VSVPGLHISREKEDLVRSFFAGWSDHFQRSLYSRGVPWLVESYAEVVSNVASQSCSHGSGGTPQTGTAWQNCCGTYYEYSNDLAVRDALEGLIEIAADGLSPDVRTQLASLDETLYALYVQAPRRIGSWWHEGFPSGIVE
jgi:hypothetical protein